VLIKGLLVSKGYSCHTAEHGRDAINIIKQNSIKGVFFQVILMDCDMPVMDGWQATQALMEMYENNEIPYKPKVLAHTAYSSPYDIERCKQAGMIRHICKNIPKDDLFDILSEYIQ